MPDLSLLAVSSRTATLLLAPKGTRFALLHPVSWQLAEQGEPVQRAGVAKTAALFVEGLEPARTYILTTDLGELTFDTAPCAGLVEAADHGVDPGHEDSTRALADAIAAVPEGGTLRLPRGRITTGPIYLRPRITVWLPQGCVLTSKGDRTGWPILSPRDETGRVLGTWEGLPEASFAAPLTGIDCDELILTGCGTIDGGGDRCDWWTWPKETRDGARRPRALFLAHSDDVQITGLTIRNAPSWTVHPYRCDRLLAAALTIRNPPDSPNTDGFNPESCIGGRLIGLDISVGDDCIAVKSGKRGANGEADHLSPTCDLTIAHCRMARGHGAVVMGSEMSGDITDVTIRDCDFHGTDRGLRVKTRRGRGGEVARITLSDIVMRDVAVPVALNAFYFCDPDGKTEAVQSRAPAPADHATPHLRDITLTDVTATGVTVAGIAAIGLPEAPIEGVTLERVAFAFDDEATADVPLMAMGINPMRHVPLFAEFAHIAGRPATSAPEPTEPA